MTTIGRVHAISDRKHRDRIMIIVTLQVRVLAERREEVLQILRTMLEPARVKPGCISFRSYQDIENESRLCLVEEWNSKHDLDRRIRSDDYRKLLELMEMSAEKPELLFHTVSIVFITQGSPFWNLSTSANFGVWE